MNFTMNKLRIAIIGTGGIANAHINAYLQMEDVEIVGGSDIIPGKARAFFDRYNLPDARDFEDTEEMLRTLKPDAVSVCTYNSTHAVCAIAAASPAAPSSRSSTPAWAPWPTSAATPWIWS